MSNPREVIASTLEELDHWLNVDPTSHDAPCSTTVAYRGCKDAGFDLCPSIARLNRDPRPIEGALLSEFRKYGSRLTDVEGEWGWWCFGQHHGLPTRFLDWSHSQHAALHFATEDMSSSAVDGVIWMANYGAAHQRLPPVLRAGLIDNVVDIFDLNALDGVASTLSEFDALATPPDDLLLFLEPPSFDDRIQQQAALFSVMTRPDGDARDFLDDSPPWLRKVTISSELKEDVRRRLDQNRQHEWLFFPDAAGLSNWLRRRFTENTSPLRSHTPPASTRGPLGSIWSPRRRRSRASSVIDKARAWVADVRK